MIIILFRLSLSSSCRVLIECLAIILCSVRFLDVCIIQIFFLILFPLIVWGLFIILHRQQQAFTMALQDVAAVRITS